MCLLNVKWLHMAVFTGRTAGSHDNIRRQLENLNKCVQYCIDEVCSV